MADKTVPSRWAGARSMWNAQRVYDFWNLALIVLLSVILVFVDLGLYP
jgi:hypothetical protein